MHSYNIKNSQTKEGKANILVGIPSYNNAQTIGHVAKACQCGLAKYFPNRRSIIVNSDGGSTDGTPDIFMSADTHTADNFLLNKPLHSIDKITIGYNGIPGKGSAIRAILEEAFYFDADVCVIVDADLRSITPLWMELLAGPIVYKGFDYVAPLYFRHKCDGTITNSIAYPLTAALYGKKVRQPIGGDFGISRDLIRVLLQDDYVWQTDVARFGIDIWMTTTAICEGFNVCQSFLGTKIHNPKDPSSLALMFEQVVGTIFSLTEQYKKQWQSVDSFEEVPTFGFYSEVVPKPVKVDIRSARDQFRQGFDVYEKFWDKFLPEDSMLHLQKMAKSRQADFNFTPDLWARVVYSFAEAYRTKACDGALVKSLIPLYLGYTASFARKIRKMSTDQMEKIVDDLCTAFLKFKKTYL